ncbi:MAG: hypothetical protein QME76_09490 [Bacillota bacterium]|nr:hypothetical protein [Bacillota bacterium]
MPAGIKPKAAIEKVFGQFFREVNFEPVKSIPPDSYRYGRKGDDGPRRIQFDFNWAPPILLRDLRQGHKHLLWVGFRWKDETANVLYLIREKIWREKCPHIVGSHDPVTHEFQLTPEEQSELHAVWDNDPVVTTLETKDWGFLTQEELESVLELWLWAIKEHDLVRWLEAQEQQGPGT